MVGDAQQHAQTLKDHLDKLKSKALGGSETSMGMMKRLAAGARCILKQPLSP